jgi:hypothetical protein
VINHGNVDPHPRAGIDGAAEDLPEIACVRSISGLGLVVAHSDRDVCEAAHTNGRIF